MDLCNPYEGFFRNFEKEIYSIMLKRSKADHSSLAEIKIRQLFIHDF